jgi:hypothetical protein
MFTFFFRHKFFSLFCILVISYFFINPAHKFGYCQKSFIIFNRIPATFFDLYITPEGSLSPIEDLSKKDLLADFLKELSQYHVQDSLALIVGMGFDRSGFRLSDSAVATLETKGIHVQQLSTRNAIRLYNSLIDRKENVAALITTHY